MRERQKLYSWVLTQALTMEGWTKLAFVISDMYKCFSDDEEQQMIWLAAHISSNKKYSLVQNPKRQRWLRYRDGDLLLIGYLGRQPDRDLLFFFSYLSFCRQYTSIYALEVLRGQRNKLIHTVFVLFDAMILVFPYSIAPAYCRTKKIRAYFRVMFFLFLSKMVQENDKTLIISIENLHN